MKSSSQQEFITKSLLTLFSIGMLISISAGLFGQIGKSFSSLSMSSITNECTSTTNENVNLFANPFAYLNSVTSASMEEAGYTNSSIDFSNPINSFNEIVNDALNQSL